MHTRKTGQIYEMVLQFDSTRAGSADLLKRIMENAGIEPREIVENEVWPLTRLSVYSPSASRVRTLLKSIRLLKLRQVTATLQLLRARDWQTKWKEEFRPFALTRTFGIIPIRFKNKFRFHRKIPIYLDTDVAFGTGLHATTRFMARFVECCKGKFESCLDLGTGTGILAMIADKCGAKRIDAIDISRQAVKVARQNSILNKCRSIRVKVADAYKYRSKRQYDLVCANIITQDLIRMARTIIRLVKPGKYLAVSGISINSYPAFRRAYARYPLRCLKVERGEGWTAILFKKTTGKTVKKSNGL